ncbi:MAG: ferritin family protein [Spirochaetia bacterium]|nr:ferritin family protein [Spirochaetia bacterium]
MSTYSADEIFQFAIRIEENGRKFYLEMAEKFKSNEKIHALFQELSKQEVEHAIAFETILKSFQDYFSSGSYPEEYFTYLRAYANNSIFSEEILKEEKAKISDLKSAFDFAIRRELESISYYNELKNLVSPEDKDKIEQIIEEERKHFLRLNKQKQELV